jgi:hypothetical protein
MVGKKSAKKTFWQIVPVVVAAGRLHQKTAGKLALKTAMLH